MEKRENGRKESGSTSANSVSTLQKMNTNTHHFTPPNEVIKRNNNRLQLANLAGKN